MSQRFLVDCFLPPLTLLLGKGVFFRGRRVLPVKTVVRADPSCLYGDLVSFVLISAVRKVKASRSASFGLMVTPCAALMEAPLAPAEKIFQHFAEREQ